MFDNKTKHSCSFVTYRSIKAFLLIEKKNNKGKHKQKVSRRKLVRKEDFNRSHTSKLLLDIKTLKGDQLAKFLHRGANTFMLIRYFTCSSALILLRSKGEMYNL